MSTKPKKVILTLVLSIILSISVFPKPAKAQISSLYYFNKISAIGTSAIIDHRLLVLNIYSHLINIANSSNNGDNEAVISYNSKDSIAKAERLDAYFEKRDMPLAGHGMDFVKAAEKYDIDWRLAAAIGVRESSGGKHMMNNNPFGWGSAEIEFDDFSEAIDVVSMNLGGYNENTAKYYKDTDTETKLWYYNGTVIPSYPQEVIDIMEMM